MVVQVSSKRDLEAKIAEAGDKVVIIDFYATWCGPCKMISPQLEVYSQDELGVMVLKVDVDEAEELAAEYDITAMPTFIIIKNGAQVEKFTGANIEKLKELTKKFL